MELLSPAGNWESLRAAVENGADAVYFGGGDFNARRFAANFSGEELKKAVDYCHLRGVRAYLTLNTLVLDREIRPALAFAAELYRAGADAVLVQDLGLAALLRREIPELCLHASTQMAVHNLPGVREAAALGMERVVLARELSLRDISHIHENCDMELECFVHGALCMCVSGNCLFSSMAGGRSGNRGACAQPCRKRMRVMGKPAENDFHLSLSDLCMLGHVEDLRRAGVCSLKIEGRMKRAEYVAAATRAYRAALDGADARELASCRKELLAVFGRGEGQSGYYYGDGARTNCVAQSAKEGDALLASLRKTYERDSRKRPVSLSLRLYLGERAQLSIHSGGCMAVVEGEPPAAAEKPVLEERLRAQLAKLGNSSFFAKECRICSDGFSHMPVAALNAMRRAACGELEARICAPRTLAEPAPCPPPGRVYDGKPQIRVKLHDAAMISAAFSAGADEVLYEPWSFNAADWDMALLAPWKGKILLAMPAFMGDGEMRRAAALLETGLFCGAEANNIGQFRLCRQTPRRLAGLHNNVLNCYTLNTLRELGFAGATLSPELGAAQMRDILRVQAASVYVYGRLPLMQLRHCPRREHLGCAGCRGEAGYMCDEAGRRFPLHAIRQEGGCLVRLLNCDVLDTLGLVRDLQGVEAYVLEFFEEDEARMRARIREACRAARGEAAAGLEGATRGHWKKPLQ